MKKKTNDNLVSLVKLLNDGHYHTGEALGEELQITRSAVWKAIKKLLDYGIKIDSVKGKGYALLQPLTLLDINKMIPEVKVKTHLFESLPSTNRYLKSLAPSRAIHVCLAEQQTDGKGRFNREWHSPFGQNIYLSCLYPFQKDLSELSGLSLVVALAVLRGLRLSGISDHLFAKWPNDILYDHKKLAGILIEVQGESHGVSQVVIGIGINVNMMQDEKQITQSWISMQKILGQYVDRNIVCLNVINELVSCLKQFELTGFSAYLDEWKEADCLLNRDITIKNVNEKTTGKVVGVNQQGHLLLRLSNGTIQAFSSGEATIMGSRL